MSKTPDVVQRHLDQQDPNAEIPMSNSTMDNIINNETDYAQADEYNDQLTHLRKKYRAAYDFMEDQREEAFQALDYYHGHQLSDQIMAEMRRRKQPPNYWNKIRPAIEGVLGLQASSETAPEATARNDNDDSAAGTITEILRYLSDENQFDGIKMEVAFDNLVCGIGANIVEVNPDTGDSVITHVPYNEFFYDPYSLKHDFRDAKYLGRAKYMDKSEAMRMFPEFQSFFAGMSRMDFTGDGPDDQPTQSKIWLDERQRVLIAEIYFQDAKSGHWMHANFCHAGVMDYEVSPFQDEKGQPSCPIIATSYAIDRQGTRYGMVRDMIRLQDSINARISRMLHLTNSAQVEATSENALPSDRNIARAEASKADGAMPAGWRRVPVQDVFAGNKVLLDNDMQAIERMAPSPALLGRAGGANESGRARQVLQQAGLTELERAFAHFENWELRCYKSMWARTKQFMKEPRMIRITDNAGVKQTLMINQPAPLDPNTGQPLVDPKTGQPAQAVENLEMDLDITLKTVRDADSLRSETIDTILMWSQKTGVSILDPQFELVLELVPLPNKDYILKKFHDLSAQQQQATQAQQQQQAQVQQQQMQLAQQGAAAKVAKTNAEADKNQQLANLHHVQALQAAQDTDHEAAAHPSEFKLQQTQLANEKLTLQIRQLKAHLGIDPDQPFPVEGDSTSST